MTLETFQKAYGQKLDNVLKLPEFRAAVAMIRTQRREMLLALSPEDIKEKAQQILGGLVESVRFENDLMTLTSRREFKMPDEAPLEFVTPEEEAEAWAAIDAFREKKTKRRAA